MPSTKDWASTTPRRQSRIPEGYSSLSLPVIRNSGPRNVKLLVKSLDAFQKEFFPASVTALHHLGDRRRPPTEKGGPPHPPIWSGPAAIGARMTQDWVRRPFPEQLVLAAGTAAALATELPKRRGGAPGPAPLEISGLVQAVRDPARRCRISPIRIRRASRLSLQCIYSCAV